MKIEYVTVALAIGILISGCTPCTPTSCPDCVNETMYSQCRERENFYHNILILQGYFDKVCQVSSNNWQVIASANLSIANATYEFRARPRVSWMDGVIGLAVGNVSGYSDLAATVRFNPDGYVDIRDGATYANSTYQYVPCENYRFQMRVDFSNQTYSVAVDNGTTIVQLAGAAAFRETTTNVTSLSTLAQISDRGEQKVCVGE